jgi:hypothetical protein
MPPTSNRRLPDIVGTTHDSSKAARQRQRAVGLASAALLLFRQLLLEHDDVFQGVVVMLPQKPQLAFEMDVAMLEPGNILVAALQLQSQGVEPVAHTFDQLPFVDAIPCWIEVGDRGSRLNLPMEGAVRSPDVSRPFSSIFQERFDLIEAGAVQSSTTEHDVVLGIAEHVAGKVRGVGIAAADPLQPQHLSVGHSPDAVLMNFVLDIHARLHPPE